MPSHAKSAQTLHLFCLYRNQDFFCIPFPQTMLCTLSSGLGEIGLWTFYDSFLIKAAQPENLFSLEVFLLYISNLCQPQKMLIRVTFLQSKGAVSYHKERTNQLKVLMWLIPRLLLVFLTFQLCFSYIPTMLTNALPWTMDKGYGNLAASIGLTMKSYTSTTLIVFNSSKGSISLECFRLPLSLGRL